MSKELIPASLRESLKELSEDLSDTVEHWFDKIKPGSTSNTEHEQSSDFWTRHDRWSLDRPNIDIDEDDDTIYVTAELPGLDKKNLNVDLDGRILTLSGEKTSHNEKKHGRSRVSECRYGTFSRSITLPCEVKCDAVKARYRHGVLKLTLPKTEDAKARRIDIDYED